MKATRFFNMKTTRFFVLSIHARMHAGFDKMPATPEKPASDQSTILQNASVKGAARKKGVAKTRKARPLKNVQLDVLTARLAEIKKRVRTAECKMTLLKEKEAVHEEEVSLRATEQAAEA